MAKGNVCNFVQLSEPHIGWVGSLAVRQVHAWRAHMCNVLQCLVCMWTNVGRKLLRLPLYLLIQSTYNDTMLQFQTVPGYGTLVNSPKTVKHRHQNMLSKTE